VGEKMKKDRYNDIFVKISAAAKKKGGSLGAIFKLTEELLDFEEKIQECINAQEMSENKQKIESFIGEIDKMYDVLFEMARGGISNIRDQRKGGQRDGVLGVPEGGENDLGGEEVEVEVEEDVGIAPTADKRNTPVMLNVPQIPKM